MFDCPAQQARCQIAVHVSPQEISELAAFQPTSYCRAGRRFRGLSRVLHTWLRIGRLVSVGHYPAVDLRLATGIAAANYSRIREEEKKIINTVNLRDNMQDPLALNFAMRITVSIKHITRGELPILGGQWGTCQLLTIDMVGKFSSKKCLNDVNRK